MACIYYTASSLDGYIVDDADSLDWLLSRDIDPHGPFHYEDFAAGVGALVMGSATYEWIARHEPGAWPYTQPSWVMTSRPHIIDDAHPVRTFSGDVRDLYPELVAAAGDRHVWVVGGGVIAAQFVTAGLVDEMVVTYAPCSLGAGSPVLPVRSEWTLAETAVNGEFLCARWVSVRPVSG
ncbi:dihydrofolate reductase family protein [Mycolicibacterium sp. F2034L]|uniref:dihydrofolate reductase family protein n=1 Tax=Mycolicibacterium sp. F2034L TaxID=2926422 RepID=UPI001FF1B070|nr:dihydrofolate reductase family protein [Mycolicibacterium sp. F2034L]MCK0177197.1 dihydrofolate reductase family protein [Mycolicibacterium sp. F2034L]